MRKGINDKDGIRGDMHDLEGKAAAKNIEGKRRNNEGVPLFEDKLILLKFV